MQLLHCDKPYNLDEAAARRGTPRRKRKDSRTTAYELTIRIPEEHRRHFGGKKKLTRVVFALNKKVDLKGQVRAFEEEKRRALDEMGLVLRSSTPLLGETGNPWSYNSFKKRWNAFVRKAGFAGTRPYALRHTFATINLARGENIKTVSVLLGHADASYTLDLYVGFIPATTRGLANHYVGGIAPKLIERAKAA